MQKFRALNVFCGSSRTLLLGVMLGGDLLSQSHVKAKLGGGDSQQSIVPTSSCPHGLALTPGLLPVHP